MNSLSTSSWNNSGVQLPLFAAGSNMMATPSLEKLLMIGSYLIIRRGATKAYLATLYTNTAGPWENWANNRGISWKPGPAAPGQRDGSLRYPRRAGHSFKAPWPLKRMCWYKPVVISYSVVPEDLSLSERAGGLTWISGYRFFRHWLFHPHRPLRSMVRGLNNIYGRSYMTFCQPRYLFRIERNAAG